MNFLKFFQCYPYQLIKKKDITISQHVICCFPQLPYLKRRLASRPYEKMLSCAQGRTDTISLSPEISTLATHRTAPTNPPSSIVGEINSPHEGESARQGRKPEVAPVGGRHRAKRLSNAGMSPHRISPRSKRSASATFPPALVGNDPQGGSGSKQGGETRPSKGVIFINASLSGFRHASE